MNDNNRIKIIIIVFNTFPLTSFYLKPNSLIYIFQMLTIHITIMFHLQVNPFVNCLHESYDNLVSHKKNKILFVSTLFVFPGNG